MVALKHPKPVRRKTGSEYRGRPLVAEMHERYLEVWPLRQAGRSARIDWTTLYEVALHIEAKRAAGKV